MGCEICHTLLQILQLFFEDFFQNQLQLINDVGIFKSGQKESVRLERSGIEERRNEKKKKSKELNNL